MQKRVEQAAAAELDMSAIGDEPSAYRLMLPSLRLPLHIHLVFNAIAAFGMLLIGHPWGAAAVLLGATGIDAVQQMLLRRWTLLSDTADPEKGLRKLAVLCVARVSIYIAPATTVAVMTGGLAELAFFGIQFASLLTLALGAGVLSKLIFWSFSAPIMFAAAILSVVLFPPVQAAGILLGGATLLILLMVISESTAKAIKTWFEAYQANVALVDELALARDLAVAERQAADVARELARNANSAKSNFLATMSHEIRTPMNGVLGMAQLMKRDEADPVQTQRLDVLIDSGEYLLSILNDILDVSKIDAGKVELVAAPENLHGFLDRVVGFWGARADEKGVRLALDASANLPEWALVDALRLRQIVFNLVGNALKFTEEGSVTIIAEAVRQGTDRIDLQLSVRDTGPGIAAHHMASLFDRFSQVEDVEGRRFGGTGLGLSIVKQLTELMRGRVWVDSTVGEGSTFHIEIPLQLAVAPAETERPQLAQALSTDALRVLAVDDNAVNLMVLEQLLMSLGHEIAKASSGAKALELMEVETFDLVLSDIQMPGMTGVEMFQRLRGRPGLNQSVPVIAITADVTSGGRQRYLDLGFTEHAAKPIQLEDLLASMARALESSPAAVQAA